MDQSALLRIALLAMTMAIVGFVIVQSLTRNASQAVKDRALLICLGLYAVLKLDELLILTGAYMNMPHIAGLLSPLRILIAPAFFIYVRALTVPAGPLFRPYDLWASSGPAVFLTLMSWYFVLPADAKRDLLSLTFNDPTLRDLAFTMCRVLFAWFFLFSAVYVFLSLRGLQRHDADMKARFSDIEQKTFGWLHTASLILLGMLGWYAAGELWAFTGKRPGWFSDLTAIMELATVTIFCVCAVRQPPIHTGSYPAEKPVSTRWSLPDSDLARIGAALQRCMQTQQLYVQSDLALKDLASAVKRSEDHVSQALGRHLKTNFYAFVNEYRIEEARRLLRETDMPVFDIGLEVGFNSKSTFNASFKRITGRTPTAYRDAQPVPKSEKSSEKVRLRGVGR